MPTMDEPRPALGFEEAGWAEEEKPRRTKEEQEDEEEGESDFDLKSNTPNLKGGAQSKL